MTFRMKPEEHAERMALTIEQTMGELKALLDHLQFTKYRFPFEDDRVELYIKLNMLEAAALDWRKRT